MASRSIEAGKAFLRLIVDNKDFGKQLDGSLAKLDTFGKSALRVGAKITAVGAALSAPFAATIKLAGDAQESINRFTQVFGAQADAARKFADEIATSVGRSKIEILDALGTFQSFFVGLGFGSVEARQLSQTLESLALDFASFNNLADDEAVGRFISALSGSSEVLDRFGINIKQAALQQELLRTGVNKAWTQVTEQEKAIARLSVIMRAMTDQGAVGDAVRTAGSFTNQLKAANARLKEAGVAIGTALLPAVTSLLAAINPVLVSFAEFAEENQTLVAVAGATSFAILALGTATSALGIAMIATSRAIVALRLALTALARHPYAVIATVLLGTISAIALKFIDFGDAADESADSLGKNADAANEVAAAVDKIADAQKTAEEATKKTTSAAKEQAIAWEKLQASIRAANVSRARRELDLALERARALGGRDQSANLRVDELRAKLAYELARRLPSEKPLPDIRSPVGQGQFIFQVLPDAARRGGRPGFASGPQRTLADFEKQSGPLLSTFSGRLAGQIFGGQGDPIARRIDKLIAEQQKALASLEKIDENTRRAQQFTIGSA